MTRTRRFLVTGARGMLGQTLLRRLEAAGEPCAGTDLPEVNLTDPEAARRLLEDLKPSHVIHCAAYTNVDAAESDAETARLVNVDMPRHVARACAGTGARMLLISTDFVFDGAADRPYRETDAPAPISVYGQTKLDGERAVADELSDHLIARTAWLYGPGKRNFVSAMYERLSQGLALRVVDDQHGSPTFAVDLADRLASLALHEETGVFHLVNAGVTTWCGLTRKIAELGGFDPASVEATDAAGYPTPARRPAWSVLDCSRAWSSGLKPMRCWTEALEEYVHHLRSHSA